jgi:glycine C-acetyltransferase
MVDDSHASGFMGKTGRGTHEFHGVMGKIDIITTTFGKALGGASGGCISGHQEIIDWMRNKARPYLFQILLHHQLPVLQLKSLIYLVVLLNYAIN